MSNQDLSKLHEDIGYIKAQVAEIPSMKKDIGDLNKKVANILGYATGISAVFSLMIIIIKDKISKYL